MDFNSRKTFWKCLGKVLCLLLCVYLLWVYVVLEHKVDGRGSNSAAVVSTHNMDRGKYMKWISESGTEQTLRAKDINRQRSAKTYLKDHQLMKNFGDHHLVKNVGDHHFVKHLQDRQLENKLQDRQLENKLQDRQLENKLQDHRLMKKLQKLVNRKAAGFHGEYGENKNIDKHGNRNANKGSEICKLYPDIIIVGFEKCGTMTLRSYFGAHPEIFITKRPGNIPYFEPVERISFENFTKHMPCTPAGKLKLDKITVNGTAVNVSEVLPNVKLLAIVREPVERAMSHYLHHVSKRKEKPNTFDAIIKTLLAGRIHRNKTVATSGLFRDSTYIDRLEQWLQTFGRDKIHVVDGDNFVKHPAFELNKIEKFLNISQYLTDGHFVYNPVKKCYCLKGTGCMGSNKGRPHPNMTENTRKRLQAYFKPFNEKLFLTLGQRFPWNY